MASYPSPLRDLLAKSVVQQVRRSYAKQGLGAALRTANRALPEIGADAARFARRAAPRLMGALSKRVPVVSAANLAYDVADFGTKAVTGRQIRDQPFAQYAQGRVVDAAAEMTGLADKERSYGFARGGQVMAYDEDRVRRTMGSQYVSTPSSRPKGMSAADYVDFLAAQRDAARRKNGLRQPPSQSLPPVPAPRVRPPDTSGVGAREARTVVNRGRQVVGDALPVPVPGQRGGPASAGPATLAGRSTLSPVEVLSPGTPRVTGSPPVGSNRYGSAPATLAGRRTLSPVQRPVLSRDPVARSAQRSAIEQASYDRLRAPANPPRLPHDPVASSIARSEIEQESFDKLRAPRRAQSAERGFGLRQFPAMYARGGRVPAPARTPMIGVHPVTELKPSLPLPADPVKRSVVRAKRESESFDKLDAPRRRGVVAKRKYGD